LFSLIALVLPSVASSAAPPAHPKAAPAFRTKVLPVLKTKASSAKSLVRTTGPVAQASDVVPLDAGQNWMLFTVPGSGTGPGEEEIPVEMTPPGGGGIMPPIRGTPGSIVNPPPDPGGEPGALDLSVYVLHGDAGVNESPLPATIKDDLTATGGDGTIITLEAEEESVYVVRQDIAEGIEASEAAGELTPEIAAIAEPLDGDLSPSFYAQPPIIITNSSSCAATPHSSSRMIDLSLPSIDKTFTQSGGLNGTFSINGNLTGSVTGEINFEVKRKKVLFWCVPYGAKFKNVHVFGNASTNSTVTATGTLNYAHSFGPSEVSKTQLFTYTYWVYGIIPVTIGFNLPITAGLNVSATTTGTINVSGNRDYAGTFDWTCTLNDCQGTSSFTSNPSTSTQTFTAGISGHIKPEPYANISLRAYLYTESVAYAQAGLEPHLLGDLWAYAGNTCGDGDGDGVNESVNALTFDLDSRLDVTGQASVFGSSPWKRTFSTGSIHHIGLYDLLSSTSTAMTPELRGPANGKTGIASSFTTKMRSCWPYTENVTYQMAWGDGSAPEQQTGAPGTALTFNHTFTNPGTPTVADTVLTDQHGRTINKSTSRPFPVCATLAITGQPVSTSIETGLSATLSVASNGTVFQWYRGASGDTSNPIAGGTGSSVSVNPTVTTSYWVKVSNACNDSLNSSTATVTIIFVCHADGQACGGDGNHTCQAGQCVCSNCASGVCCGTTGNSFCDGQAHSDPNTGYAGACSAGLPSCTAANDFNGNNSIFHNGDILACVKLNGVYQWFARRPSPRCQEVNAVCDFECSTHYSNGAAFVCDQGGSWNQNPPLSYCNNGTIPGGYSCQVCPSVTSQPQSTSINLGQSATLSVAASGSAPTYQWYRGTSGDTSNPVAGGTGTSITVNPSTTTSYWVRASNTCGPVSSATATVTVTVPPSISVQPQSVSINAGATATLSVTATGSSPLFYQWYQGAAPIKTQPVAGGSAATVFVSPGVTTSYWVEIWNNAGTVDSITATVTVGCGPNGTSCGGDGHHTCQSNVCTCTDCASGVCCGATGSTTCDGQAHTDPNTGYAGSCSAGLPSCTAANDFNGTNSIFHNGDILACVKLNGVYQWTPRRPSPRCQEVSPVCTFECSTHYSNGGAFVCDQSGNWNQNPPLSYCNNGTIPAGFSCQVCPLVTSQPPPATIVQGNPVTLSVTVTGSAPTYQWYRGNSGDTSNPVATGTGTSITVTPSTTTNYWVRASNTCGSVNSSTATVTVNPPCTPPSINSQPQSTTINPGATATLSVGASGTSLSYQWYVGAAGNTSQPVAGGNGPTIFVSPSTTTSYWAAVWNSCGTLQSSAATVTLGCGPDGASCGGDGHHTCQAGACSCTDCASGVCCGATGSTACDGQAHTDPNTGYSGSCSSGLPSCTAANDFNGNNAIFHGGEVLGCVKLNGVYQWAPRRPSPRCQEVSPVCTYLCATHYANGGGFVCDQGGSWNQNPPLPYCNNGTIPGGYSCQVCPSVTSQPQSTSIVQGQSATLSVAASGSAPTYQWYRGNSGDTSNPVAGGTGTSITVTPSTTTNYWVRALNTCGPANSSTAAVTVTIPCTPPSISSQPQSTTINPGATATLSVGASGSSLSYQWYQGASGNTSQPVGSGSTLFVSPATTTSYWVAIWNGCGSLSSSTATVTLGCGPDGASCGGDGHHTCQAGACSCTDCNSSVCCGASGNAACDGQQHFDPNTGYTGACKATLPSCNASNDFDGSNLFHNGDIVACVKHSGTYGWVPRRPSPRCQEVSPVCDYLCANHYNGGAGFMCDSNGNWNTSLPLAGCYGGTIPSSYLCP